MKKFIKSKIALQILASSVIASFAVAGMVSASTTVGTNITTGGTLTVGTDGVGTDFTLYTDTAGEELLWDASANQLLIDGLGGTTVLAVTDGNVVITDDLTVSGTFAPAITTVSGTFTVGADHALDTDAAGALNIGTSTATSITIGSSTKTTTFLGIVNVDEAVTLDTTLGVTGAATLSSTLAVSDDITIAAGKTIDAASAGALYIGTSTATSIAIGLTGVTTTVTGPLTVAEAFTFDTASSTAGGTGTLKVASITSDTGAISFGDDNLVTTGTLGAAATTLSSTLGVTGAATFTAGAQSAAVARTATAAGDGTGLIADGTSFVTVTCADANNIITLPTPTPGNIVWLYEATNGFELRSDTPASVAINAGSGADAESAVAATQLVRCVCTTATTWVCTKFAADGTESALEAAA